MPVNAATPQNPAVTAASGTQENGSRTTADTTRTAPPRSAEARSMNLRIRSYAVAFLALALLCGSTQAATLSGRVVKVSDGDTITVLTGRTQHRIRLSGIDAPEIKQPFGQASRKHLASMIAGQAVTVEWHKRDKYGRIVGKVWHGTTDAGLSQIRNGFAWHFKRYQIEQTLDDREDYAEAEDHAKQGRVGLWKDNDPNEPWAWRKAAR